MIKSKNNLSAKRKKINLKKKEKLDKDTVISNSLLIVLLVLVIAVIVLWGISICYAIQYFFRLANVAFSVAPAFWIILLWLSDKNILFAAIVLDISLLLVVLPINIMSYDMTKTSSHSASAPTISSEASSAPNETTEEDDFTNIPIYYYDGRKYRYIFR